jgi:hypothetical protein
MLKAPRRPGQITRAQLEQAMADQRRKYEEGQHQIPVGPAGNADLTGSGFIHVTNGVPDKDPKLIETNDISDHSVTLPKLQQISTKEILARKSGGDGEVERCSLDEVLNFKNISLPMGAIADIATADATDLPTAIALANDTKAKVNEVLAAWRAAGLLTP